MSVVISSVNESANDAKYMIYPNPTSTDLTILSTGVFTSEPKISVYNILGQKMIPTISGKDGEYRLDVTSWMPGNYFIQLTDGNQKSLFRVSKI
ncbi:MAG: T9SS type A sorting domain-containing protein [Saprospiraceae bacterium]|nr:T9SS type A sorting domain-containing protein [Saprospiraceae bacterium]